MSKLGLGDDIDLSFVYLNDLETGLNIQKRRRGVLVCICVSNRGIQLLLVLCLLCFARLFQEGVMVVVCSSKRPAYSHEGVSTE